MNACCNVQRDKSVVLFQYVFFKITDLFSLLLCTNLNNSVALEAIGNLDLSVSEADRAAGEKL